jgi:hypothetical protein
MASTDADRRWEKIARPRVTRKMMADPPAVELASITPGSLVTWDVAACAQREHRRLRSLEREPWAVKGD